MDITRPSHKTSIARSRFAMLCVDGCTRFKMVRFLKCKDDDARVAMCNIIATHVVPFEFKVVIVRTDGERGFGGLFHSLLKESGLQHERTLPYTPQYNGVVERALGLLRDKTIYV